MRASAEGGPRARTQSCTHVGQGEGAAAAALVGLLVASQLVEGARLAEQRPDVLTVQAQRLLAVLQRLLVQALPERSGRSASALTLPPQAFGAPSLENSLPSLQRWRRPEDPLGRRLQSPRKQLRCSHSVKGIVCPGCQWTLSGHWRGGPSQSTAMSLHSDTSVLCLP